MGGADAIMQKAKTDYAQAITVGWRNSLTISSLLIRAIKQHALWKQMPLSKWVSRLSPVHGVKDLRNGVVKGATANTASPDTVKAMSPEMFFDYLAVHINGEKAANVQAVFNVDLGADGGKYKLELENGVLNHSADAQASNADASITLNRATLNKIILKEESLKQAEEKGGVQILGDQAKLDEFLGYLDSFYFWFNIVTP